MEAQTASRPPEEESQVGADRVRLLCDGAHAFPEMLAAIAEAKREVLLEMYWFDSDATGRSFQAALLERAKAGVVVRVIYDAIGSLGVDENMFAELVAAGADVREYNPLAPWRRKFGLGVVNNRDHRKILVVDTRVAFTGGINLADAWAPEESGGGGWRDDMVRIEGPAAHALRAVFFETWANLGGAVPETGRWTERAHGPVRVLSSSSRRARKDIRRAYLAQIASAKRFVYITNSYFVPDLVVRRALRAAIQRGVDVRVLVPGESDVRAVFFATRHLYARSLKAGVRIFEWTRSVLHAKTAVVDGEWCTLGTFNLDYRSWRYNEEVNVAISDGGVANEMRERFLKDCDASGEVKLADWKYRPLGERVLEWFYFLFRKLL